VVTEEWFYASLSAQHWVDPKPHLHEHYAAQQLARGLKKPQRIFLKLKFFIGFSSNPSDIFLSTIISASGGSISDDLASADLMIFGMMAYTCMHHLAFAHCVSLTQLTVHPNYATTFYRNPLLLVQHSSNLV
jgi:hypothetical protein